MKTTFTWTRLIGALLVNLLSACTIIASLVWSQAILTFLKIDKSQTETFQLALLSILILIVTFVTLVVVLSSQSRIESRAKELSDQEDRMADQGKSLQKREDANTAKEARLDAWDKNLQLKEEQLDERVYAIVALTMCASYAKQAPSHPWTTTPSLAEFCYESLKLASLEDLENSCSKIVGTIKAIVTAVVCAEKPELNGDNSWLRVAIFLPGRVRKPVKTEDHGKRAMFVRATTDLGSFSHREGRYLLAGQGCAGAAWAERRTIFGHPPGGKPTLGGCGSIPWANLRAGHDHEHPFQRLACVPIFDPADKETVLAVVSLDTSLDDFLVDREQADVHVSAATQAACLQLGILIRCCSESDHRSAV